MSASRILLFYLLILNINKYNEKEVYKSSACCFDAFDPDGKHWAAGVDMHRYDWLHFCIAVWRVWSIYSFKK